MPRRLTDGETPFDARDARSAGARSRTLREVGVIPPPPGATPPRVGEASSAPQNSAARLQTAASVDEGIDAPQVTLSDPAEPNATTLDSLAVPQQHLSRARDNPGPPSILAAGAYVSTLSAPIGPAEWNADGFVGETLDGFPYPRAGEDGQLGRSGEPLRSTILRVAPEQRRILHQIQQLERRRSGVGVELERIIDCALVLLPEDLDALERFVAEAPRDLLRRQPPADIGTRLRASVHQRLDEIRERLGAEGRVPLRLTTVHRAALYHYSQSYLCRASAL